MGKIKKSKNLKWRGPLLAGLLIMGSMFAGCTTDRNLGDGDPNAWTLGRTAPTAGSSTGSERPALPPPMTSSYSRSEALPPVARTMQRLHPDDAAAIMAGHRPAVRQLGPVNPGGLSSAQTQTGLTMIGSSPRTVNASLDTPPTQAILNEANVNGAAAVNETANAAVVADATQAALQAAAATPAGAATPVSPGAFAAGPATSVTGVSGAMRPLNVGADTTSAASTATSGGRTRSVTVPSGQQLGTATGTVRIVSGANGRVVVTNQQ